MQDANDANVVLPHSRLSQRGRVQDGTTKEKKEARKYGDCCWKKRRMAKEKKTPREVGW